MLGDCEQEMFSEPVPLNKEIDMKYIPYVLAFAGSAVLGWQMAPLSSDQFIIGAIGYFFALVGYGMLWRRS